MESQGTLQADRPHNATASAGQVALQVIATTEAGTRAALLEARQLSRRFNAGPAVLLVPWTSSSTASLEATVNDAAIIESYLHMADESGVDVAVRLCICGAYTEAFRWMLPRNSTVVVGGRRRWWWPTFEQRIADLLKHAGHQVVFADASDRTERYTP